MEAGGISSGHLEEASGLDFSLILLLKHNFFSNIKTCYAYGLAEIDF
jgi:hypothetical protein